MANNNDILSELKSINNRLDSLQTDVTGMKGDITSVKSDVTSLKQGQAQTTTALEALAAGQAEIKETMATKADVQDLKATLTKKVHDHENRIIDLEKEAGIPHPHKH